MANIQDFWEKYKGIFLDDAVFYGVVIVIVGIASFGLGRVSVGDLSVQQQPASIILSTDTTLVDHASQPTGADTEKNYVGSVNSDKYHLPWCSGAQRINEANKVWFSSIEEAERAGYVPAANCEGI